MANVPVLRTSLLAADAAAGVRLTRSAAVRAITDAHFTFFISPLSCFVSTCWIFVYPMKTLCGFLVASYWLDLVKHGYGGEVEQLHSRLVSNASTRRHRYR